MPRLLLLHDHAPTLQTQRAVSALASRPAPGLEVTLRTLGAGGDDLNPLSAAWRLRGLAREYDLIHVFGHRPFAPAAFAPFRTILYTPTQTPARPHLRFLLAVAQYRDLHVICPTVTLHRRCVTAGLDPDRCHLIRPGVDFSRIHSPRDHARRSPLRAALGFDDSHHVLLLPGESTNNAGHDQAAWAAGILKFLDDRVRLLFWGRGPRAKPLAQLAHQTNQRELITSAEQRLGRRIDFEELLPAADTALVTAIGPVDTLPIAQCMAAALPMVATVTPTVAELLEDRHSAMMCAPGIPRLVARRIVELRADRSLRQKLIDTARTEAYEFFPQTRFVKEHQALYERVAKTR